MDASEVISHLGELDKSGRGKAEARYRTLLTKVAEGKATKADGNELHALLPDLNMKLADLQRDVGLLQEHRRLKAVAGRRSDAATRWQAADEGLKVKRQERSDFLAKIDAEIDRADQQCEQFRRELDRADEAENNLRAFEQEHGNLLFGAEDAASRNRRRHLIDDIAAPIPSTLKLEIVAITLGGAMHRPDLFDPEQFEFVPVQGHQTQAQCDDLVRALRECHAATLYVQRNVHGRSLDGTPRPEQYVKFLLPSTEDRTHVYGITPAQINEIWANWRNSNRNRYAENRHSWTDEPVIVTVRAPGQSIEEYDALLLQINDDDCRNVEAGGAQRSFKAVTSF